ncbi:MAG TPA: SDR family NAD(P)-dependent oxidoreductase [Steroidobacteraceae bacterium]|nr:SDR family NAD(P)-dependent oxidoreductase [Steroidobacteraceae bacterium]
MAATRSLALVTGASSGIGLELARQAATRGYDLIIAADESLETARRELEAFGATVTTIEADLATRDGVDSLYAATKDRRIDALLANAGHGLGKGFLDQDFADVQHVINTNITGTIDLIQRVGREMRSRGAGKILITGSIAGFMPGTFQAVYNGSKAFLDSFSYALRNELKDSGVTVTCLMPGATDTDFFQRAELLDTKVGADPHKDDPADVAKTGFDAMEKGEAAVVAGLSNKLRVALANIVPNSMLAEQHRKMAAPGTAQH